MRNYKNYNDYDFKFKPGDIVRYDTGKTALMRLHSVLPVHGGNQHYYTGTQCMGGNISRFESDLRQPSDKDLETWFSYNGNNPVGKLPLKAIFYNNEYQVTYGEFSMLDVIRSAVNTFLIKEKDGPIGLLDGFTVEEVKQWSQLVQPTDALNGTI